MENNTALIQNLEKKIGSKLKLVDNHLKNLDSTGKANEESLSNLKDKMEKLIKHIESEEGKATFHKEIVSINTPKAVKNINTINFDEVKIYTDERMNE